MEKIRIEDMTKEEVLAFFQTVDGSEKWSASTEADTLTEATLRKAYEYHQSKQYQADLAERIREQNERWEREYREGMPS